MLLNARKFLVFFFTTRPKHALGHNQASRWGDTMAGAGIAGGRYLQAHKAHWVLPNNKYICMCTFSVTCFLSRTPTKHL